MLLFTKAVLVKALLWGTPVAVIAAGASVNLLIPSPPKPSYVTWHCTDLQTSKIVRDEDLKEKKARKDGTVFFDYVSGMPGCDIGPTLVMSEATPVADGLYRFAIPGNLNEALPIAYGEKPIPDSPYRHDYR